MGTKTRMVTAWAMLAALLLAAAPLPARERRGARVVVERKDGSSVSGELLMVKKDGLVVADRGAGAVVGLDDVRSVRIVKKSRAGTGFLIGLLASTAVGFAATRNSQGCNGSSFEFMFWTLVISLPSGGVGALIGSGLGRDPVLKAGELQPELLLGKLNRLARVPDAALSGGR